MGAIHMMPTTLKPAMHREFADLATKHATAVFSWTLIQPKSKLGVPYLRCVVQMPCGPTRHFDQSHVFDAVQAKRTAQQIATGLLEAGFHNVLVYPKVD
jgi:hypothetical protein